jgi:hypothetical protein
MPFVRDSGPNGDVGRFLSLCWLLDDLWVWNNGSDAHASSTSMKGSSPFALVSAIWLLELLFPRPKGSSWVWARCGREVTAPVEQLVSTG